MWQICYLDFVTLPSEEKDKILKLVGCPSERFWSTHKYYDDVINLSIQARRRLGMKVLSEYLPRYSPMGY